MCAMCGCSSEAFMGVELPSQNVYDVGPGQLPSPVMFGTDSMNPLGSGSQQGELPEAIEDAMEEDLD